MEPESSLPHSQHAHIYRSEICSCIETPIAFVILTGLKAREIQRCKGHLAPDI